MESDVLVMSMHACNIANRVPGMELVAICDGNTARAKEVAEELNVEAVYADPAQMCADPNVEAVAIFTNTASHVDMIKIAMEAGKHVFCEKPLAENVEKCLKAEEIIKAHPNQVFMLGFMRRFDKSYRIGATPSSSLVEALSEHGVCHECYQDFVSRWHDAYITEMEVFCDYVAKGEAAEPNVYDGTKATRVAYACKESFLKNELLTLD